MMRYVCLRMELLFCFVVVQLVWMANGQPADLQCDVERNTLDSCLLTVECQECYDNALVMFWGVDAPASWDLCDIVVNELCAISTTCPCGLGCESDADSYYQCIHKYFPCTPDTCANTTCAAEFIAAAYCDQDGSCLSCVDDALPFDAPSCTDFESTLCMNIDSDACDCLNDCANKVESMYSCLNLGICPSFECPTCSPFPSPSPPESGSTSTASPSPSPPEPGSTSKGGSTIIVALVAVLIAVAIIGGIIFYIVKRKKKTNDDLVSKRADNHSKASLDESHEPPTTPTTSSPQSHDAHTEHSHHRPREPYFIETTHRDEDYIYGRRPGSVPRAAPFVSAAPVPVYTTGDRLPENKDQCRSVAVANAVAIPMAASYSLGVDP